MTPDLTERFLAPKGWITHSFVNDQTGHNIFYGRVYPQDKPPSAIIVCLGGLSEFSEKYYEVAHDMLDKGYAFWILDWQYQGRSGRLKQYPQRRHSDGFESDVLDLKKFVDDYIVPAAVHPDVGRIPLIMLAHSMGGNIGLRFLSEYPKRFDAAAFTAPFLGIHAFSPFSRILLTILTPFMCLIGKNYVPKGTDWKETFRKGDGKGIFSGDTMRDTLHGLWSRDDESLRIGQPTLGWASQALRACAYLKRKDVLESIKIPVLVAAAGNEEIVDNGAIRDAATRLPNAQFIEIAGARHEIMMDNDEYRGAFFKAFDKMVEAHKIATIENVKPF